MFTAEDAAATEAVGAALAQELREGDVVFVSGELGAGKTTLVRGACRALGVEVAVTSPTFAIAHRYPARAPLRGASPSAPGASAPPRGARPPVSGACPPIWGVAHLDLYRLAALDDETPELLDDYFGPGTIAFVEWPERAGHHLGEPRLAIEIRHAGAERRAIEVHG